MITVTRLNGKPMVVNAELIRTVEENPDTTITLINGDHLIVKESMTTIVEKVIEYGRHLRQMLPPDEFDRSVAASGRTLALVATPLIQSAATL